MHKLNWILILAISAGCNSNQKAEKQIMKDITHIAVENRQTEQKSDSKSIQQAKKEYNQNIFTKTPSTG